VARAVYAEQLPVCHAPDCLACGAALPDDRPLGYMIPRLWGPTAQRGAGMSRLIAAANLHHFNMPHATVTTSIPQLTPEQPGTWRPTWSRKQRRTKRGLDKDFLPRSLEKAHRCSVTALTRHLQTRSSTNTGQFAPIRAAIARSRRGCKGKRPPR